MNSLHDLIQGVGFVDEQQRMKLRAGLAWSTQLSLPGRDTRQDFALCGGVKRNSYECVQAQYCEARYHPPSNGRASLDLLERRVLLAA